MVTETDYMKGSHSRMLVTKPSLTLTVWTQNTFISQNIVSFRL